MPDLRHGVYLRPGPGLEQAVADAHAAIGRRFGLAAAARFMPHVTLKGFFLAAAAEPELLARVEATVAGRPQVELAIRGIAAFGTEAVVVDVEGEAVHALHDAVFAALAPFVAPGCDFTPREFAHDDFRAHLTLAMADIPPERFADVRAFARRLAPGPAVSTAAEVQLFAFASDDWAGAWWQTLTWRHVGTARLG